MSQNRELEFVETAPGAWYYLLQDATAPVESWDWHEHATAYGPFPSYEAASEHQYGYSRISTPGETVSRIEDHGPDDAIHTAISKATTNRAF